MRLRLLLVGVALPLVLWGAMPLVSSGQSAKVSRIQSKIEKKRSVRDQVLGRERALRTDVAAYSERIAALQEDITELSARQVRLQADLDAKRRELADVQERLRRERARLVRLRARLAEARMALAARLVELHKTDEPDVLTVVLQADGFAELLSRTEFMQRVSRQDSRILERVRVAKRDAVSTEKRLAGLEQRQKRLAAELTERRDEVARVRGTLVDRRDSYASVRSRKTAVLTRVKGERQNLEGDLRELEREQARVAAALQQAAANNGFNPSQAGPIRTGGGGLVWPVSGPVVSPFGPRWGRLHAGVDIASPSGTPIRAAAGGKVVLLGWTGGYGNYVCIQHGGALSTCYAHLSSYGTSNGASVARGQVIGAVGCTGHCFGDHLHFETRVNGQPVDPAGYL